LAVDHDSNTEHFINMFDAGVRNIHTSKSHIANVLLHYFHAILQLHNSPGDCAKELFKRSKDVASLLDCKEKNGKFCNSFSFVGNVISGF